MYIGKNLLTKSITVSIHCEAPRENAVDAQISCKQVFDLKFSKHGKIFGKESSRILSQV